MTEGREDDEDEARQKFRLKSGDGAFLVLK